MYKRYFSRSYIDVGANIVWLTLYSSSCGMIFLTTDLMWPTIINVTVVFIGLIRMVTEHICQMYMLQGTYRGSVKDLTHLRIIKKNKKRFLSPDFWMLLCVSQRFYWLLKVFKMTTFSLITVHTRPWLLFHTFFNISACMLLITVVILLFNFVKLRQLVW